jgi:hypothetical protein
MRSSALIHIDKERTTVMRRLATVAILGLAGLAGCGGLEEDSYKLVKVTGTVTRNGKPLPGATVSFVPSGGNKNSTPAADITGPEGTYSLMFKGRTGIAPGKYNVMIAEAVQVPAGSKMPAAFKDTPGIFNRERPVGKEKGAVQKKKEGAKSEFTAEVDENIASKTLDYDVKS